MRHRGIQNEHQNHRKDDITRGTAQRFNDQERDDSANNRTELCGIGEFRILDRIEVPGQPAEQAQRKNSQRYVVGRNRSDAAAIEPPAEKHDRQSKAQFQRIKLLGHEGETGMGQGIGIPENRHKRHEKRQTKHHPAGKPLAIIGNTVVGGRLDGSRIA